MIEPPPLSFRSETPLPDPLARAIAAEVLRPSANRCWARAAKAPTDEGGPSMGRGRAPLRIAQGTVAGDDPAAGPSQEDVLWVLCQLARFARDLRLDFEVRMGELRGRVGTFGLDAGALELLARSHRAAGRAAPHLRLAGGAAPGRAAQVRPRHRAGAGAAARAG